MTDMEHPLTAHGVAPSSIHDMARGNVAQQYELGVALLWYVVVLQFSTLAMPRL